jgi:hypothetical protein
MTDDTATPEDTFLGYTDPRSRPTHGASRAVPMLAGKHAGVQAAGPGKEKPQRMQAWGWRTLCWGVRGVARVRYPLNRLGQHMFHAA